MGGWLLSNTLCHALKHPAVQLCKGIDLRSWSAHLAQLECTLQEMSKTGRQLQGYSADDWKTAASLVPSAWQSLKIQHG